MKNNTNSAEKVIQIFKRPFFQTEGDCFKEPKIVKGLNNFKKYFYLIFRVSDGHTKILSFIYLINVIISVKVCSIYKEIMLIFRHRYLCIRLIRDHFHVDFFILHFAHIRIQTRSKYGLQPKC